MKRAKDRQPPKSEAYLREEDGRRMVEVAPHRFVNEAAIRRLGGDAFPKEKEGAQ